MSALFPEPGPRLFTLPPGADFPARLVQGLHDRLGPGAPERMARVTLILNTQRMRRRVREMFRARGAVVLPRLMVVTDLAADPLLAGPPETHVSSLGRRLELAVLIDGLLSAQPDLAPRSALYDLADSLAALMDEMRAENVPPERLDQLEMEGHAGHWSRTRAFVSLVGQFFGADAPPDAEARLRGAVDTLLAAWREQPHADPIIVAGSTGSRGTTSALMQAVARQPQGALVLPGVDMSMPAGIWRSMDDAPEGLPGQEDHPQYRYHALLRDMGLGLEALRPWDMLPGHDDARNRLVSLALRPAPVTDQWIDEGPLLGDLAQATAGLSLLEAPQPRAEAQAIALVLRRAVHEGRRATLISPDRELTRRVSAALDRWGIRPDDSAGQPLLHSAPGRMLRLLGRAMGARLPADQLLALLKHPLTFTGAERGPHLRLTTELELHLRRHGPAYPDAGFLTRWAATRPDKVANRWAERLGSITEALLAFGPAPLDQLIARHRALAEALSRPLDQSEGSGELWEKAAGETALKAMDELAREAPTGFTMGLGDYRVLVDGVLSRHEVRDAISADDRIEIFGPQEARIIGTPLVILAGLNEGIWPAKPSPDPWLNRKMRLEAGLLLPERRIGLAAHDFQMAIAAPEVLISRAIRDAEAETVPSRWLNRLTNLLEGLGQTGGPAALAAMRARGARHLADAEATARPEPTPRATRPSPVPPLAQRPSQLSLTEIETLIRDPFAIYARHVLKLRALAPLRTLADARLRGEVLHRVPELFLKDPDRPADPEAAVQRLLAITDQVLDEDVPWPATRAAWRARMAALAEDFVAMVLEEGATPAALEQKTRLPMPEIDFTLVGKPDRIDLMQDGSLRIVDYKTGTPPTVKQQEIFAKQLHLAALMAHLGAFPDLGAPERVKVTYVQLKEGLKEVASDLGPDDLARIGDGFRRLIRAWAEPDRGYTARRAMAETTHAGDYDDLARLGEWDITEMPVPKDMP